MRVDAHANLGVGPVAAGIGHIDQDLARPRHGVRQLGENQLLGTSGGVDDDGFHELLPDDDRWREPCSIDARPNGRKLSAFI